VMCFNERDPRGYGIWDENVDVIGKDAICIYSNRYRVDPVERYAHYFERIGSTDSTVVFRGGIKAKTYYFTTCKNLIQKYEPPY